MAAVCPACVFNFHVMSQARKVAGSQQALPSAESPGFLRGIRSAGRRGPPCELPEFQEHGSDDAGQGVA
eukprot:11167648-Lingulodinium_polyedra.AAC.1